MSISYLLDKVHVKPEGALRAHNDAASFLVSGFGEGEDVLSDVAMTTTIPLAPSSRPKIFEGKKEALPPL